MFPKGFGPWGNLKENEGEKMKQHIWEIVILFVVFFVIGYMVYAFSVA